MTCFLTPSISTKSAPGLMVSDSVASSSSAARNWSKYAMASLVPSRTLPESGAISPRISLSSVVLPLPLGPMRPTLSPRRMRDVNPLTTSRPP